VRIPLKDSPKIFFMIAISFRKSGLVIISYSACIKTNYIKEKSANKTSLIMTLSLFFIF